MKQKIEILETKNGNSTVIKKFKYFGIKVIEFVRNKAIVNPDCEYSFKEYSKDGVEVFLWSRKTQRFF